MAALARELDERVDRRRHAHDFGLGRPAAPHRHDDHVPVGGEQTGGVSRDRRLADALTGAHDRQRGQVDRGERRRVEAEVRSLVGDPVGEHAARERHALDRPEHGLVREVEHQVRRVGSDRLLDSRDERDAVVVAPAELLRAAEEDGRDDVVRGGRERIAYHRGVVLPVDQRDSPHAPGRVPPLAGRAGLRRKAAVARERMLSGAVSEYCPLRPPLASDDPGA
jgi:hypothetical protein